MLTATFRIIGNQIACTVRRDGIEIDQRIVPNDGLLSLYKWRQRRYPDAKIRALAEPPRRLSRPEPTEPQWA